MAMDFRRMPPGFNGVSGKAKYEGMAAKLLERAEGVARHLLPLGRKEGDEWVVGSLNGERGKSLKVNLKNVFEGASSGYWVGLESEGTGAPHPLVAIQELLCCLVEGEPARALKPLACPLGATGRDGVLASLY
jgi:hypothetical protein